MQNQFYFFVLFVAFLSTSTLRSQATATAGLPSESAYSNLQGAGNTGFGVEGPDAGGDANCTDASRTGDHSDFDSGNGLNIGEHITHVAETELPGSSNVFLFHSHVAEDSDRCRNLDDIDRIRTEIKGGPAGDTNPELEHEYGTTSYYRWQFRLDAGFVGTSRFTHLFQLKASGGPDDDLPIITITARANDVEIIHTGDSDPAGANNGTVTKLDEPLLTAFRGRWVEVFMKAVHANADDGGEFAMRINDVLTGNLIANVVENSIDMWRGAANSTSDINRPKWGIYRGLMDGVGQRDETVRFANFCSSEAGDICPSLLPEPPAITVPTGLLPLAGSANVPLTMNLMWDAVEGSTSYNVYFGTAPNPPLVGATSATTLDAPLAYAQVYYYRIEATNGSETSTSEVKSFSTLAQADINDWKVARGHARPDLENGTDFSFNSSVAADVEEITEIAGDEGNNQYTYFVAPSGNYRARYDFANGQNNTTVVLRMSRYLDENDMIFVEVRNAGLNQKMSIKADRINFERTPAQSVDFDPDFFDDGELHVLRLTFSVIPGMGTDPDTLLTDVYLDEAPTPAFSVKSTETASGSRVEIGKAGGTTYGANIDFIAVNPAGAFSPGTAGRDLPADLLQNALLPVHWVSPLTVENRAKDRLLRWTVAQQQDSDYFTVERSTNGSSFSPLVRTEGDGNHTTERSFFHTDDQLLGTGVYYRIRQTDYDGNYSFSNVAFAGPMTSSTSVNVAPNPVTDRLSVINLPAGVTGYRLLSLTGQELSAGKLFQGNAELDLQSVKPGIYLLRLQAEDGTILPVHRFVKR